jgi:very-short-patch-repair endonuclease
VHRSRSLEARDTGRIERLRVTSPARTIFDLAAECSAAELETVYAEAERRHGVARSALADQLERNRGRPGAGALRALLERSERPALTRSKAERKLLALLRHSGCPSPAANQRVARYEVDLLWERQRLVVEFDGFEFHSDRGAFERDRRRDAELQARGYRVIRVTWRQLIDDPEAVVDRIRRTLAR